MLFDGDTKYSLQGILANLVGAGFDRLPDLIVWEGENVAWQVIEFFTAGIRRKTLPPMNARLKAWVRSDHDPALRPAVEQINATSRSGSQLRYAFPSCCRPAHETLPPATTLA